MEIPPSSPQSRSSIRSGVTHLFRRTSTTVTLKDTESTWSQQSGQSNLLKFGRKLSRKSSNLSMRTASSKRDPMETQSITSRLERNGTTTSRSETHKRYVTPPPAFPRAMKPQDTRCVNHHIYDVLDEEHLSSAAEIRQEILRVEGEVKRLINAFTGLEVTTLCKAQRTRGHSITRSDRQGNAGSVAEGKSARRVNLVDSDGGSIRSQNTTGTGACKSASSGRMPLRAKTSVTTSLALSATSSRPASLRRKTSSSSFSKQLSPALSLPAAITANNSSVSLTRSAHIMTSVPEDRPGSTVSMLRLDDEMEPEDGTEDIRRRREEVQQRYGARLDYLRAKLKSAELHEKVWRR